jgi:hypothetical protein
MYLVYETSRDIALLDPFSIVKSIFRKSDEEPVSISNQLMIPGTIRATFF